MGPPPTTSVSIDDSLDNLKNWDSDLRFMALSDINTMLSASDPILLEDTDIMKEVAQGVLEKLDDNNSDVQTQAVKCLDPLARNCSDSLVRYIIEDLQSRITITPVEPSSKKTKEKPKKASSDETSKADTSVLAMAIRAVISSMEAKRTLGQLLVQTLLPKLFAKAAEQTLDTMEILSDLIKRFGPTMSANDIEKIQNLLIELVSNSKGLVRKRAVVTLGLLSRYCSGPVWDRLTHYVETQLSKYGQASSSDVLANTQLVAVVQLTGILAKNEPSRFKQELPKVLPNVIASLHMDSLDSEDMDNEEEEIINLREAALNSLETLSALGTPYVESHLEELLEIVARMIKFNPNTVEDEEGDEADGDVEMADENGSNDNEEDEGFADEDGEFDVSENEGVFSDDEDQSWRLRRSAAKLGAALVNAVPQRLPLVYTKLLMPFVNSLARESEETVKSETVSGLHVLIRAADSDGFYYRSVSSGGRRSSDVSMRADTDPQFMLSECSSRLVKVSVKQLTSKSTSLTIVQGILTDILGPLIAVFHGVDELQFTEISSVLVSLARTKQSVLVEVLQLVAVCLQYEDDAIVKKHITELAEIVTLGLAQSYYKVCGEALEVSLGLMRFSVPVVVGLRDQIMVRASDGSLDIETRERAIKALGQLLAHLDVDASDVQQGADLLLENLSLETMRIPCLNAIAITAEKKAGLLSNSWLQAVLIRSTEFLKQSSRSLRVSALNALRVLLAHLKDDSNGIDRNVFSIVSTAVLTHSEDNNAHGEDVQITELTCQVLSNLVRASKIADAKIVQFELSVIDKSSFDSTANSAELDLMSAIVQSSSEEEREKLYEILSESKPRESQKLAAMAFAILLTQGNLMSRLGVFEAAVQKGRLTDNLDWSLLVLGSVGKCVPLNISMDTFYQLANNGQIDEGIRAIAGDTIGQITSNNADLYLNELLSRVAAQNGQKDAITQYALLRAIRAVIVCSSESVLSKYTEAIWGTVIGVNLGDDLGDGSHVIVAECLGRLSIMNPEGFLPQLQRDLKSEKISVRATVISAVKYTFGQSHRRYDDLLKPIVADFLSLVDDEHISVRQVALNALVSAIHNKSYLLIPHLSRLLPLLYRETVVNERLIRSVQMGPFKHKVDDGLDLRKTAYDTIYTLMTTLSADRLRKFAMLDEMVERVFAGLSDDDHDIKVLSCVIIGRLAAVDLVTLTSHGRIETLMSQFTTLVRITLKANAVKQDVEKQGEIVRNVVRASEQIDKAITNAQKKGEVIGLSDVELSAWSSFYDEIILPETK